MPTDAAPCGSKSTSSTLRPYSARHAPRLMVVVVLPTPPFWLHIAMMRAGPWLVRGAGSGGAGGARRPQPHRVDVGPSDPAGRSWGTTASAARELRRGGAARTR